MQEGLLSLWLMLLVGTRKGLGKGNPQRQREGEEEQPEEETGVCVLVWPE